MIRKPSTRSIRSSTSCPVAQRRDHQRQAVRPLRHGADILVAGDVIGQRTDLLCAGGNPDLGAAGGGGERRAVHHGLRQQGRKGWKHGRRRGCRRSAALHTGQTLRPLGPPPPPPPSCVLWTMWCNSCSRWKGMAIVAWLAISVRAGTAAAGRPATGRPAPTRRGAGAGAGWRANAGLWLLNSGLSPLVVVPVSLWAAGAFAGLAARTGWSGPLGSGARPAGARLLDLLVAPGQPRSAVPLAVPRGAPPGPLPRHDQRRALSTSREVLLSAGVRAAVIVALGIPITFVVRVRDAGAASRRCSTTPTSDCRRGWSGRCRWLIHLPPRSTGCITTAAGPDTDRTTARVQLLGTRLFGSRSRPRAGQGGMAIGVEAAREEKTCSASLLRPLRPG